MHVTNSVHGVFTRLASFMSGLRRRSAFTCGDCERSDRCGLPPSDTCVVRAAQLARGDWQWKRRVKTLNSW